MPKKKRLARSISAFSQAEAVRLFQCARSVHKQPGIDVRIAPKISTDYNHGRILIVIPRRVGTAPQRNQIRRRLRAIFYTEKLYEKNYDGIILVTKEAVNLTFEDLKKIMIKAFSL